MIADILGRDKPCYTSMKVYFNEHLTHSCVGMPQGLQALLLNNVEVNKQWNILVGAILQPENK